MSNRRNVHTPPGHPVRAGSSTLVGLLFVLASAAFFATSGPFGKPLLQAGWSPGAVVLVRVAGGALLLAIPSILELRGRFRQFVRQLPFVAAYGVSSMAFGQLFYFNAVQHLSVGVALLLEYLAPVLIVGWLWLRTGRAPSLLTTLGVVASMVGLALVLDVTGSVRVDPVGVAWGLAAALMLAVYFVLAASQRENLPPVATVGVGLAMAALVLLLFGLIGVLPLTWSTEPVLLLGRQVNPLIPVLELGVVAAAFAYLTGLLGARIVGSTVVSFVSLIEVLFAVLFAWVLLGELPRPIQLLGGVGIVLGAALVKTADARAAAAPVDLDQLPPQSAIETR
ncbi:EamA family transporter [Gephyromycinifex aptenodytis]|uniref:EamA family transporter n=1 Tax=Gephyromycinifex aptenodytis TaxID=2716227 RepID=UPI001445F6C5|nr:DMT family transporter [Gephyromycinifex aptenodytis]